MIAPASEAEVSEAIGAARRPLRIIGGATRQDLGQPVAGSAFHTRHLAGIVHYEPAALTLVVKTGTSMAEIEALLAKNQQRLAFEPMDHRPLLGATGTPSIGGVVACNISGPRRIQAGACRDFLLGVRFVDGMGNIVKSGGRVMKNVTGLDLVKLLAGSFGTLGILTEVAIKVLPEPQAVADLVLRDLSDQAAIAALAQALGSPFDISGAAHWPGERQTFLRLEGFADSVTHRAEKLRALLGSFGRAEIRSDPDLVTASWRAIRDVSAFAGRPGAVWKIAVKPSSGGDLVARVRARVPGCEALYDWGGGLCWLLVEETGDAQAAVIRASVQSVGGGHATLVRAAVETRRAVPVFQPETAEIRRICAGIRQKFDPRGILNSGIMAAGQTNRIPAHV